MSKDSVTVQTHFCDILQDAKWKTTEEMVDMLDEAKFWDSEEVLGDVIAHAKKDFVRRSLRSMRDDNGDRVFINVKVKGSDGQTKNLYKQEMLFNVEDYRYAVGYYKNTGMKFIQEANRLARNCRRKCSVQIPIPFPNYSASV
jgi:hypothetical protein